MENLRDMNENITARVKTLEGLCAKNVENKVLSSNFSASQKVLKLDTKQKSMPIS